MKTLFFVFGITLLVGTPPNIARAWTIDRFDADLAVQSDASIDITERIDVTFDVEKHGIFRTIPVTYLGADNNEYTIPIENMTVTDAEGASIDNKVSASNGNLTIRIGSPSRTVTGAQSYVLTYRAKAAVNFFDDHDEVYWNITGSDWEVPINNVHATIRLPGSVTPSDIRTTCYTGAYGSTEQRCTGVPAENGAEFTASDFLTVVVGFPKNLVMKPADFATLRQGSQQYATTPALSPFVQNILFWLLNILLPILGVLLLFFWWYRNGRDPGEKKTMIAQYDPPDHLRPAEMDVLVHETLRKNAISATIIDLAVRGYVEITEVEQDTLLGLGKKKDYALTLRKSYANDRELLEYERYVLEGIFGESAEKTSVMMSDLKAEFSSTIDKVKKSILLRITSERYFAANPETIRTIYRGIGIASLVAGGVILWYAIAAFRIVLFGPLILGAIVLVTAPTLPCRTHKGVAALWHARGFKVFLETAEKYRLQWQEREGIFEQYLPYAMTFGVAEKWSKAFADIVTKPPSWYHGQSDAAFTPVLLWEAVNNFQSQAYSAFIAPAASGSSGFGGGGFSGGGGGGGGGGSW